jgi:hypothetical protein
LWRERQVSFYAISLRAISISRDLKVYTTFQIYPIMYGLTQFGTDNL